MLDRNGLRPARYTLTTDDIFILASETGVADIPAEKVARKGRLRPGEMIYCDLVNHRLVSDAETKNEMARRMPYRRWVEKNKISVRSLFDSISASAEMPDLVGRQRQFGFTQEDVELIIRPMMLKGAEPLGSMGNDAPLAVLSGKGASPVQLFQAAVRPGDQSAHRPHPGGTGHEPDYIHRQPSQHSGRKRRSTPG